ncbi:MAG: hypothetical protein FKY71_08135 [Spiribacter salinus]|uniref:Uncharacterized protein n=1 Tax=Spiribacter salinus TaxID=1335746 RepID=A0A540VS98_9GAMM|nr:MAG: hypothetical protein FKY71_08135 [Spiribacter salinus]
MSNILNRLTKSDRLKSQAIRIRELEAERNKFKVRADHALALVAEAYKVCANDVKPSPNYGSEDQPQSHYTVDCVLEDRQLRILAKTPSDALAAREARDVEMRNRGRRDALHEVQKLRDEDNAVDEASARYAILAFIEGDQTDEC